MKRKESVQELLKHNLSLTLPLILEMLIEWSEIQGESIYLVSEFELRRNLQLEISKWLKYYMMSYLSSDRVGTGVGGERKIVC